MVVSAPLSNLRNAVKLFDEHEKGEGVGKGHGGKRERSGKAFRKHGRIDAISSSNEKIRAFRARETAFDFARERLG